MSNCSIVELIEGRMLSELLGDNECKLIMEYIVIIESFRIMESKIKSYDGINKLPLKTCIESVAKYLSSTTLTTEVKPYLDYRNTIVHDIKTTLATLQDTATLLDNTEKLRCIVTRCWSEINAKEDGRILKRRRLTSNFVL